MIVCNCVVQEGQILVEIEVVLWVNINDFMQ